MKNTIVITEGIFDSIVLKKILTNFEKTNHYKIESASGYSSALSKAQSYLSINKKVILIAESDSTLDNEIRERKYFIESYIRKNDDKNFKSILIIPEFEVLFLENDNFVEKYLKHIKENNLLGTIKMSPKRSLENILKIRRERLIEMIEEPNILDGFKNNRYIKEIIDFINSN